MNSIGIGPQFPLQKTMVQQVIYSEKFYLRLLKRLTMIVREGKVEQVCYPVFPPDRNAADVLDFLTVAFASPGDS